MNHPTGYQHFQIVLLVAFILAKCSSVKFYNIFSSFTPKDQDPQTHADAVPQISILSKPDSLRRVGRRCPLSSFFGVCSPPLPPGTRSCMMILARFSLRGYFVIWKNFRFRSCGFLYSLLSLSPALTLTHLCVCPYNMYYLNTIHKA